MPFLNAFIISGRVGYSFHPKGTGNPVIGEIDIQYEITEQGTKPWNYLAGFNWTLTPNWWIQAEYGFSGRSGLVASVTYRW